MKRCWFMLLAVYFVTGSGCALWPGGDDEDSTVAELVAIQNPVKLRARWKADVGGGDDEIFLNLVPALNDGHVYAADYRGRVWAFDARTGKKIWKTKTKARIAGGPGVGDGLVLLGTYDGEVLALGANDGRMVWRVPVTSEVLSVPRASIGVVGVQTLGGDLLGLAAEDGSRRWIYDRSVPTLTLRGSSSPAVSGGLIVGGFASGKLCAIEIASGRMIWEVSIAMPRGRSELERMVDIDADPVIRNGVVYAVSFQGKIAALELTSGRMLWTREMSSSAGLGVDSSQLYVTDDQSNVWALDQDSGATMWKQEGLHERALTAPAAFGELVAVADFEGYVHLLSRSDGSLVGRVRIDRAGVSATPVAADGSLYVLGKGGNLAAYERVKRNSGRVRKHK